MALFNIPWLSESIKKCTIKYLIQRYLGHFLSEELDLSQLNFELFNGTGSIDSIPLNVNTINEEVSSFFPLKFIEGFVNRIQLSVPWSSLWTESCTIHLDGIKLNFCKLSECQTHDPNQVSSILSKSLMTSSMEMAEEIVNQESEKFEGLEKFAQLINSVIRRFKVSARDTVIKFVLPKKSGVGQEIELRIGYIKCEEEEISLDSKDEKTKTNNALSDVITKRITFEGTEVLINDILVTKLYGKHTFKVQFDGNRVDVEAYFGSYIFAILNSDHLKILLEFFKVMDDKPKFNLENILPQERMMTSQDFRRVQEMLHTENKSKQLNLMTSSIISYNNKTWNSDSIHDDDDKFMPFSNTKTIENKEIEPFSQSTVFSCNMKIPGIMLCLISNNDEDMPEFNEMPMIDTLQTFIGINSFLDGILHDYDHIRFLASNLCVELYEDTLQFSCINVNMYEYHQETLNSIIWVKDNETDVIMPSLRLKVAKNNIDLTLASTAINLDFTLVERHYKLFSLFDNLSEQRLAETSGNKYRTNKQDESCFNIYCDKVEVELYFPIPDLREERDEYSNLRDETLFIDFEDMTFRLNSSEGELCCSQFNIDLKVDDKRHKVFHSKTDQKDIKLVMNFKSTANVGNTVEHFDKDVLLNEISSMQESVYFLQSSSLNQNNSNDPFQVKRKMFSEESNEQILTPGDRAHTQQYLAHNKGATKFGIHIHVPYGDVYLEDKAMFELIYNRIVNDLILWKPYFKKKSPSSVDQTELICADSSQTLDCEHNVPNVMLSDLGDHNAANHNQADYAQHLNNINQASAFFSCKGMSSSYDSMCSDVSYHSIVNSPNIVPKQLNEFILELEFDNINLDFYTESKNRNTVFAQNLLLGIVVGPESNANTVVVLCTENLIYKYDDKHILLGNSYIDSNNCVLNMSMDIKRESDLLKKIKLAVQLNHGLLLGIDLPIFDELWQFLNVIDEEVLGYVCPKVILELHVDIVQSGISFDNLKERPVLLHCEDIYLTSMVVENTEQTILRFFIEEALLCFKRNNLCHDTLKNYIAVIDSGIIDLNIKISKDGRIELKVSNNEINIKACADSLAALCLFVQSLAAQTPSETSNIDSNQSNGIYISKNNLNGSALIADALYECAIDNVQCDQPMKAEDKMCNCDEMKIDESVFFMLGDDDLGTGINLTKEPQVRVLTEQPIKIVENYFKLTNYNVMPEVTPSTLARYLLEKMSLRVSLFGGKDFDDLPSDNEDDSSFHNNRNSKLDVISQANLSIRSGKFANNPRNGQKVHFSQNSVIWENIDLVSHNGYITNNPHSETHFSFKSSGGTKRKNDTCVVVMLNRIKLLFENFDKDYNLAWRFFFLVQEVEILDQVSLSKIKKILYEYYSQATPRRKYSNMLSVRLICNRNFLDKNEECDLKISMKPLRINIDQDTLLFLTEFLTSTRDILTAKMSCYNAENNEAPINDDLIKKEFSGSKSSINDDATLHDSDSLHSENEEFNDENLSNKLSTTPQEEVSNFNCHRKGSTSSSNSFDNLFIKTFTFSPDVPIRLDYHGKYIDLNQGALRGLFLGLAQLNQSELYLKQLVNKHGLLGIDKLLQFAIEEWSNDIKRNQLPSILGGVGPMHSFVQLFQGIRDLFWIPIDQYRRDQCIVRGIQRGAYAFSISTALATLELANRLVSLIHTTAQFAHDVVTPPTPGHMYRAQLPTIRNAQPRNLGEGITEAYTVMREGLHDTVRGVTNAGSVSNDVSTVIGDVFREFPSIVVRPIIHTTQAASSVIVGMRNHLAPDARKDDHEKWKNANER